MIWCQNVRADDTAALTYLSWSVPAASGCMPARELERSVEALLGRRVFAERNSAQRALLGVVERREGEWFAVLRPSATTSETRELNASGACSNLNRPLVFVVATLLDGWSASAETKATLSLGLALDAHSGLLPDVQWGARLVGLLLPDAWPALRAHVGMWLPVRVLQHGMGARFQVLQVGLAVCPVLVQRQALTLALCVGAELGALRARALGLSSPRDPARLLLSLPLEAALSVRVFERSALRIELGPTLALLRPRFYFEDAEGQQHVLHRAGLWGASVRLGLMADVL